MGVLIRPNAAEPSAAEPNAAEPNAAEPNAIGATLGLLGDEWTLLIVRGAFEGARRYGDWKSALPISDAVLTTRLQSLVDADVLRRDGAAYALTTSGLDLWLVLLCIWDWEQRQVPRRAPLPRMVHTGCGSAFHPVLRCGVCGNDAHSTQVHARFSPGGSFERSAPVGNNRRRASSARRGTSGPGMFADTMAIVGNRWSSAVLGAAFLGATRFRDFEQIGAPPSTVADRLRRFVELGVFAPPDPDSTDYRLTTKGRAFFPVVVAFLQWGERWRPAADGPSVEATHQSCGAAFVPAWRCSECNGALTRIGVGIERVTPRVDVEV